MPPKGRKGASATKKSVTVKEDENVVIEDKSNDSLLMKEDEQKVVADTNENNHSDDDDHEILGAAVVHHEDDDDEDAAAAPANKTEQEGFSFEEENVIVGHGTADDNNVNGDQNKNTSDDSHQQQQQGSYEREAEHMSYDVDNGVDLSLGGSDDDNDNDVDEHHKKEKDDQEGEDAAQQSSTEGENKDNNGKRDVTQKNQKQQFERSAPYFIRASNFFRTNFVLLCIGQVMIENFQQNNGAVVIKTQTLRDKVWDLIEDVQDNYFYSPENLARIAKFAQEKKNKPPPPAVSAGGRGGGGGKRQHLMRDAPFQDAQGLRITKDELSKCLMFLHREGFIDTCKIVFQARPRAEEAAAVLYEALGEAVNKKGEEATASSTTAKSADDGAQEPQQQQQQQTEAETNVVTANTDDAAVTTTTPAQQQSQQQKQQHQQRNQQRQFTDKQLNELFTVNPWRCEMVSPNDRFARDIPVHIISFLHKNLKPFIKAVRDKCSKGNRPDPTKPIEMNAVKPPPQEGEGALKPLEEDKRPLLRGLLDEISEILTAKAAAAGGASSGGGAGAGSAPASTEKDAKLLPKSELFKALLAKGWSNSGLDLLFPHLHSRGDVKLLESSLNNIVYVGVAGEYKQFAATQQPLFITDSSASQVAFTRDVFRCCGHSFRYKNSLFRDLHLLGWQKDRILDLLLHRAVQERRIGVYLCGSDWFYYDRERVDMNRHPIREGATGKVITIAEYLDSPFVKQKHLPGTTSSSSNHQQQQQQQQQVQHPNQQQQSFNNNNVPLLQQQQPIRPEEDLSRLPPGRLPDFLMNDARVVRMNDSRMRQFLLDFVRCSGLPANANVSLPIHTIMMNLARNGWTNAPLREKFFESLCRVDILFKREVVLDPKQGKILCARYDRALFRYQPTQQQRQQQQQQQQQQPAPYPMMNNNNNAGGGYYPNQNQNQQYQYQQPPLQQQQQYQQPPLAPAPHHQNSTNNNMLPMQMPPQGVPPQQQYQQPPNNNNNMMMYNNNNNQQVPPSNNNTYNYPPALPQQQQIQQQQYQPIPVYQPPSASSASPPNNNNNNNNRSLSSTTTVTSTSTSATMMNNDDPRIQRLSPGIKLFFKELYHHLPSDGSKKRKAVVLQQLNQNGWQENDEIEMYLSELKRKSIVGEANIMVQQQFGNNQDSSHLFLITYDTFLASQNNSNNNNREISNNFMMNNNNANNQQQQPQQNFNNNNNNMNQNQQYYNQYDNNNSNNNFNMPPPNQQQQQQSLMMMPNNNNNQSQPQNMTRNMMANNNNNNNNNFVPQQQQQQQQQPRSAAAASSSSPYGLSPQAILLAKQLRTVLPLSGSELNRNRATQQLLAKGWTQQDLTPFLEELIRARIVAEDGRNNTIFFNRRDAMQLFEMVMNNNNTSANTNAVPAAGERRPRVEDTVGGANANNNNVDQGLFRYL